MIPELLTYYALGGSGAKGSDDLPADAWNNMAPPERDFSGQHGIARGLYADAFNSASAWQPNAKAATVDPTMIARNDLAARKYQDDNAALLQAIATGGPGGVAESAARANLATAQANNNALAAGHANPHSLAMAMRATGNANAAMMQGNEAKIAAMKAQEQKAAEAALTSSLAGMRAQDYGAASEQAKLNAAAGMANAGFATQTGLANQDAYLRGQATKRAALAGQTGFDMETWQNAMAKERWKRGQTAYDDELAWNRKMNQNRALGQGLDNTSKIVGYGLDQGGSKGKY